MRRVRVIGLYGTKQHLSWWDRLSHLSLATKTATAISALFVVTVLTVGVTSMTSFRQQLVRGVITEQQVVVDRVVDDLDQRLRGLQRILRISAAEITEADVASSDRAQRYLDRNTGLFAAVDRSIFLFDPAGNELAERPFRPNRRGSNALSRDYMRDTIATRQPVISEPFVTNVGDDQIVMVLTMPVLAADGRMFAILTASMSLSAPRMLGSVASTVIGKTGYLYVVTSAGNLLLDPAQGRLSERAFAVGENKSFERALQGFEGGEVAFDLTGREAVVSYKRVPASNWIVAAVHPRDEAFAAVNELRRKFLLGLLVACVVVVAAIWALTRYIMRPLVSLTQHLTSYAASDVRIAPLAGETGNDEIGALTRAFNRLTARLHQREDALLESIQRYQVITDNSTDLISKHEPSGTITFASLAAAGMLGIPHEALVGRSLFELVHPDECDEVRHAFAEAIATHARQTVSYRIRDADGQFVWFESTLRGITVGTGPDAVSVLCISRDTSVRKRLESSLRAMARTDHLTLLPNRFEFDERFSAGAERARSEGSLFAMLMIDIDRFKNINDTLGHGTGDALLKLVGVKLRTCIRDGDVAARWGGDEFVLYLAGIDKPETAIAVAQRCLSALDSPFLVDGHSLRVTASIGISVSANADTDQETMLKNADVAMYKAKRRGGGCCVLYAAEMSHGASGRLSMENALFQALDRGEFSLHYQPIVSAHTGRLAGVEALARWRNGEQGLVSPSKFIPIAEETGLIHRIGEWVLRSACQQMGEWYRQGLPRIPISVNLSSRQLHAEGFVATMRNAVEGAGFDPRLVELEITESVLMDDVEHSRAILDELKGLGFGLVLDDFGVGYSSLGYLKGFDLDCLKIDRTFTADIGSSDSNASIVRATIALAQGLHLRTVAEGVETEAQADCLIELGCDFLQGYLFSPPIPAEAFLRFALDTPCLLPQRALALS